jgi:hypothetical protein
MRSPNDQIKFSAKSMPWMVSGRLQANNRSIYFGIAFPNVTSCHPMAKPKSEQYHDPD